MEEDTVTKEYLRLYDAYADMIFRLCVVKVGDREVARDLTQDAFMRVWDYIASGKHIINMKAFLYTVAGNLIKDWYKKKKSISLDALSDEFTFQIPDGRADSTVSAEMRLLFEGLDRLPDDYRTVLELRFVEDLSLSEIARLLGEKENTISVRINRAQKELRKRMNYDHE